MRESPRTRRLRSDLKALEQLAAESWILEFNPYGTPPDFYILRFRGRGFWKPEPTSDIMVREEHEVRQQQLVKPDCLVAQVEAGRIAQLIVTIGQKQMG